MLTIYENSHRIELQQNTEIRVRLKKIDWGGEINVF